jgi:hypothetical protein
MPPIDAPRTCPKDPRRREARTPSRPARQFRNLSISSILTTVACEECDRPIGATAFSERRDRSVAKSGRQTTAYQIAKATVRLSSDDERRGDGQHHA